jgi:hypothetical protein
VLGTDVCQIAFDGVFHEPRHVMDVQFPHQARAVSIHCFGTKRKPCGYFFGSHTVDQEGEDLELATTQEIERIKRLTTAIILAEQRHDFDLGRNVNAALAKLS